jgi:hypothetical protein
MHLKMPKLLQQLSKLLQIRTYFYKRPKKFTKCICQKVFSRPVKWLNLIERQKENNQEILN